MLNDDALALLRKTAVALEEVAYIRGYLTSKGENPMYAEPYVLTCIEKNSSKKEADMIGHLMGEALSLLRK